MCYIVLLGHDFFCICTLAVMVGLLKPHESPGVGGRDARRDKDGTSGLNERWTISEGMRNGNSYGLMGFPLDSYGISIVFL